MGYTIGRRLTYDFLKGEAKKYKTRTQFQLADPSCYTTARRKGILDEICSHMKPMRVSIPQKICQQIFNRMLGVNCLYNTRKIIPPYELDLYYSNFNLAIEYHGKRWHTKEECVIRDNKKRKICEERNINLIVIEENNRRYEEDIKRQVIKSLDKINQITGKNIDSKLIYELEINYNKIFKKKDLDEIKEEILTCTTIKQFQKNFSSSYLHLRKIGKLDLLDHIRKIKTFTNEETLEEARQIKNYKTLVNCHGGLYQRLYKRNLLEIATSHMKKTKREPYTSEQIKELATPYKRRSDFRKNKPGAYRKALKLGLIEELFPISFRHNTMPKDMYLEKVKEIIKKENIKSRTGLKRKHQRIYLKSHRLKIMDILFPKKAA